VPVPLAFRSIRREQMRAQESQDPVHVVGHHDERIQGYAVVVFGDFSPTTIHGFSDFGKLGFIADDISKAAYAVLCA